MEKVRIYEQSCVHLWFENRFGEPYAPLTRTDDAPTQFVAPAFALAVRLEKDDTISVAAPYGLDDVFDMVIRPNPVRGLAKGWDKVVASARARWPEITVIEPASRKRARPLRIAPFDGAPDRTGAEPRLFSP